MDQYQQLLMSFKDYAKNLEKERDTHKRTSDTAYIAPPKNDRPRKSTLVLNDDSSRISIFSSVGRDSKAGREKPSTPPKTLGILDPSVRSTVAKSDDPSSSTSPRSNGHPIRVDESTKIGKYEDSIVRRISKPGDDSSSALMLNTSIALTVPDAPSSTSIQLLDESGGFTSQEAAFDYYKKFVNFSLTMLLRELKGEG